jgi:hypothetical protein
MLFADARGHHRLPRPAGQLRQARGGLCVCALEGSGRVLLENELRFRA